MDQVYVCTQCGEESDAPGSCQMCGLALVPMKDDVDSEEDVNLSDDDSALSGDDEEDREDLSLEEEQEEEIEEDDAYDSFDDEDNA